MNDRSNSEFWSSFSSSEERLLECKGLILNLPLTPHRMCTPHHESEHNAASIANTVTYRFGKFFQKFSFFLFYFSVFSTFSFYFPHFSKNEEFFYSTKIFIILPEKIMKKKKHSFSQGACEWLLFFRFQFGKWGANKLFEDKIWSS